MSLTEPMTMVTDYLVAACGLWWGTRLARLAGSAGQRTVAWWALGFGAIALAAFAGGTWHGFQRYLTPGASVVLWKATLLAAGLVGFAILAASFSALFRGAPRALLLAVAAVKLLLYAAWMLRHDDFVWVILDYGGSMVVALALHAAAWWRRREPAAPWIVAAILVSFAGAAVQAGGLALHQHFNHNDLYHVIQLVGLYLFYRGALLARDGGE
jgi:hypothetical protein